MHWLNSHDVDVLAHDPRVAQALAGTHPAARWLVSQGHAELVLQVVYLLGVYDEQVRHQAHAYMRT